MAFVVEDGSGLGNATSFASVQEFKDYHTDRGNTTVVAWNDVTIQVNLIKATDYISTVFHQLFKGQKKTGSQALAWPRYNVWVEDRDPAYLTNLGLIGAGFPVDSSVVPLQVKAATIELAVKANGIELVPQLDPGKTGIRRKKIGPIMIEYGQGEYEPVTLYRWVTLLLREVLRGSSMSATIVRS